ncbi:MAG: polysaccharide deacetylase family protein [Chloroflexi bacterium]|nr:polysaccharide deacetylase family protein [Chloroflexota bacterium]MBV9596426.1 polysaccharide deacetylase family protein [Chloroflexota bacterium]
MLQISTSYAATSVSCPIYMFHQSGAAAVESVIRANARAGRTAVTVAQLAAMVRGVAPVSSRPPFCLTFDDGYLVQYQQALPVLERYHLSATFFIIGTVWQGDGVHSYMNLDQVADLYRRGHEIGSHTVDHRDLVPLRAKDVNAYWAELVDSKAQLEALIDDEVSTFAYPDGSYNLPIMQDVAGIYDAAVSTATGVLQTTSTEYALRRTRVS